LCRTEWYLCRRSSPTFRFGDIAQKYPADTLYITNTLYYYNIVVTNSYTYKGDNNMLYYYYYSLRWPVRLRITARFRRNFSPSRRCHRCPLYSIYIIYYYDVILLLLLLLDRTRPNSQRRNAVVNILMFPDGKNLIITRVITMIISKIVIFYIFLYLGTYCNLL